MPRLDLAAWGLEGFARGEPMTLYHGTTRLFRSFDLTKSRGELVDRYYGKGIFLVPSKRVASKYANAKRNMGFDPSIVDDLKRRNPGAGRFLKQLVEKGRDVWDDYTPESLGVRPEETSSTLLRLTGGVDPNTLQDIASYVIGSKTTPLRSGDSLDELFSVLTNTPRGMPEWIYKSLEEIGLDSTVYRPKVYEVEARAKKTLVTASKAQARSAQRNGYDGLIFHGPDIVDNVPEVAIFNPKNAVVKGYTIV